MSNKISAVKGLEQGRAKFAYECALEGRNISSKIQIRTEWYKDSKYKSYVKKVPALIKTNGLGSTFAFIKSKGQKGKDGKNPGMENNPKNAYDLIYEQTSKWFREDEKRLLEMNDDNDLIEIIISLDSLVYRAATNEVIAFFNWLIRFADGLIKEDTEND